MALFSDVQAEAQKELDRVIDDGRIPDIDSIKELPYVRGVVEETLRWMPTTVGAALPHAVTTNDNIDGYDIPAGASVLLAVWTINNDPTHFPDPRRFEPARHNASLRAGEAAQASDIRD